MIDLMPLFLSFKTALLATAITSVLGILVAKWMVDYNGKSKGLIDGLLSLPLVLPPTVVGFFLLLLIGRNGPVGKFLNLFDITLIFSWEATVIAAVTVSFPLMYKTVRSSLEQVDINCINAAKTLGVSQWRIFFKITLPQAWPGIIAGVLFAFARSIGEFGATLMIAGNIPGRTQTIPIAIFFAAESGNMTLALIWVLVIVTISLGVTFSMNVWLDSAQKHKARNEV